MHAQDEKATQYCCPGERCAISRAVHLGRLVRAYPPCRRCPHCEETATLSDRQVRRVVETRSRCEIQPLFRDEGAGGQLDDFSPGVVRKMAAALGVVLRRRRLGGEDRGSSPSAVVASDGRPPSGQIVAAVSEGLRWAGCGVVDIGSSSAPSLAFAIKKLLADGGVLVGNSADVAHQTGLAFWAGGPWPLSASGSLELIEEAFEAGVDRPTRRFGPLRRFQATEPYLATLAEHFHALRPLRVVVDTSCAPLAACLERLTASVACRIIDARNAVNELSSLPSGKTGERAVPLKDDKSRDRFASSATMSATSRLSSRVLAETAHFGVAIDGFGETCRVVDERGKVVPAERLLMFIGRHVLRECRTATICLEHGSADGSCRAMEAVAGRVVTAEPSREAMAAAMRDQEAHLGGGASDRLWHIVDGLPLPDALRTVSILLVLLSQSDRPLSEVLDRRAALS